MTTVPLPEGYELHELPADYSGSLWIEGQMHTYAAAQVAKERERLRAMLMSKHEAAKGQHNLYHCLAVELFGEAAIRAGS